MNTLPETLASPMADLTRNPSLATIRRFEGCLRQMPQKDMPVNHHFAPGVYLRELILDADDLVVGKLHKTQHFLLITKGRVECRTEDGMRMLEAGDIVETMPGMKRVLLAHEDTRMVTVHVTDKTDLAAIEADVIEPEAPAIEQEDAA